VVSSRQLILIIKKANSQKTKTNMQKELTKTSLQQNKHAIKANQTGGGL